MRLVSIECSQQSAEEVTAEYHLPCRQESRGGSAKYASTSPRAHFMLDSRVKALEGEVRTIKALAMIKDVKRCQEHRDKFIKRVRRGYQMEATAQKVAVVKWHQLIIHTQNLQRFKDLVKNSSRPIQRAGSLHAPQGTDESKYPAIRDSIDRKRKKAQEPSTHPQQSPNAKRANKEEPAKAEDEPQRRHDTRRPWKCDKAGCSRSYANTVHLANHHKEDHPSPNLKCPFLYDKCASKFVQKREVRWRRLRKVQEELSSSLTIPSSRAQTASNAQHQVAREEDGGRGKSTESNKPRCSQPRAHWRSSLTSGSASESASTASLGPRSNARLECYEDHHVPTQCRASEQTDSEQEIRHPRSAQSRLLDLLETINDL